jgi:hypothetical protein
MFAENDKLKLKWCVEFFSLKKTKYAVFGAGQFTRDMIPFILQENFQPPEFIFDNRKNLPSIEGIPVLNIAKVAFEGVDKIILGTDTYQKQMTDNFAKFHPNSKVKLIDLKFVRLRTDASPETSFKFTADSEKLLKLHNKHIGKTAFLIGNGPSVRIEDLEKLQSTVSFCCNRFYLAYENMKFRPENTVSCDKQMLENFGQEMRDKTEGDIFFATENKPALNGDFYWLRLKHLKPHELFKESILNRVTSGGGALIVAMQLGFFMGITKYFLYGVDHSFKFELNKEERDPFKKATGEGNHFIKGYRSGKPWCPPNTQQIEESFILCDKFMRERSGWVKNATRGGKLEVLERMDFDDALMKMKGEL